MPFVHSDKKAGDLIRSADWNAVGTEVVRLGIDKISRVGEESLDGPLTVRGALAVGAGSAGGGLSVKGDLAVGTASAGSSVRVLKRQEDGKDPSHGALVLGTDAATSAALRIGYFGTYSWLQGQGQQAIAINPHGGNVGVGATAPGSRLAVGGNASIGAGYAATAAPANGLIVQGALGAGIAAPVAVLHVNGDTVWNEKAGQRFILHPRQGAAGDFLHLTVDDAAGGWEWTKGISLKRDGSVGVGTNQPQARLHVAGGALRLDAAQEIFFADNGQIRSLDNSHRILFRRSEDKLELREYGSIIFSPGATAGNETAKAMLTAGGWLAVGTTDPKRMLHVEGTEVHSGGSGAGYSFGNRNTTGFVDGGNGGERWVLYSYDKIARLWSGNDKLWVTADGSLNLTGRLVVKSGRATVTARNKIDLTSTAWNDMPNMSLWITTTGNQVLVMFKTGGVQTTGGTTLRGQWRMFVAGVEVAYTRHEFHNNGWELRDVSMCALASPPAGTHEVKVQWAAEGGTLSACWYADNRTLIAVEM